MLAVHGSLCTQKDKVNDVPRQNQLTPKIFKENQQPDMIPKLGNSEIRMEILKTIIGGGGLERLHFVYMSVFRGKCCKQ